MSVKNRKGECVGGGYFVYRRGKKTGRIGCKYNALPFEHDSYESAHTEAKRLAGKHIGETFIVLQEIKGSCVFVEPCA